MPTDILAPDQHLVLTFPGAKRGQAKIYVEASAKITIFVTTPEGAKLFKKGDEIEPLFDSAEDVEVFNRTVSVKRNTAWTLLIVNYDKGKKWDNARAVHYDITEK